MASRNTRMGYPIKKATRGIRMVDATCDKRACPL